MDAGADVPCVHSGGRFDGEEEFPSYDEMPADGGASRGEIAAVPDYKGMFYVRNGRPPVMVRSCRLAE